LPYLWHGNEGGYDSPYFLDTHTLRSE